MEKRSGDLALCRSDPSIGTGSTPRPAYVPYQMRKGASAAVYSTATGCALEVDTDFLRFLKAMAEAVVIYDPGIKLEDCWVTVPSRC